MLTHRHSRVSRTRTVTLVAAFAVAAVALLILLAAAPAAGAADRRSWVRHYAGSAGSDVWTHIAAGPSGTVYVAGWRHAEAFSERMVVAKYTASGRRIWLRTFAGRNGASPGGLAVDAAGNAFVAGSERYDGAAGSHIAVLKYSSRNGTRKWLRRYDGPAPLGNDFARAVAVGPKGAVYVTGGTTTTAGGFDALLVKFVDKGSSATRAWIRTYRNPTAPPLLNADEGVRVVLDRAGRLYWAGSSDQGTGKRTVFVRRVAAATGKAVWTDRVPNDPNLDLALVDLAAFPAGGVVAAGVRSPTPATGVDTLVVRYAATGAQRFSHMTSGTGDESARALAVNGAGDIAVAGTMDCGTTFTSAMILRGDAMFSAPSLWSRTFVAPAAGESASFSCIAAGPSGSFFCGGRSTSGFISGVDFLLTRYSSTGVLDWSDVYDDKDANKLDGCRAALSVGGAKPGLYGAGFGGYSSGGEGLLIKYVR